MKNTWRWTLFSACLLLLAARLAGQNASEWRVYKAADGLPETLVSAVSIAPRGHVWAQHLYTGALTLLDGYTNHPVATAGLGNHRVYESASGQIWTVCEEGLQLFKESNWVRYPVRELAVEFRKNNPGMLQTVPLFPLKQNHVLFPLPDRIMEFNVENPANPQVTVFRALAATGVKRLVTMFAARDGGLWVLGARGLLKLPGPARNVKGDTPWQDGLFEESLGIENPREPMEDDTGGVTVLADDKADGRQVLAHWSAGHWSVLRPQTGAKFTHAWLSAPSEWWACSQNLLYQWREPAGQPRVNEEISVQHFFDVASEPNGVFWLATSDGLYRHAPTAWRTAEDAPVHALVQDQEERLWSLSDDSVRLSTNGEWKSFRLPVEVAGTPQDGRNLYALGNGLLTMAIADRLVVFNPADGSFNAGVKPGFERLRPLGLLPDGRLCVQAAGDHTLFEFDGHDTLPFPMPAPPVGSGNELLAIFAVSGGGMWLSGSRGLFWYHDQKWQAYTNEMGALAEGPSCLLELGEGRVWFGLQDRIWEFDGKKSWQVIQGGFDRVNAMLKGRDGSVWVASNNGVHRYVKGTWMANGEEEGLRVRGGAIRALAQDRPGQIWAGGRHGLSQYHPEADTDPPHTFIRAMDEPNNSVPEGRLVTLNFGGQDRWKFTASDRLLFSHRLDEKEWSPYRPDHSVSFLELSAGRHYFQVRSMDRNWNVDPVPARLEFSIALPWYKESRLLFISLAGLAVAVFFAGLALNRHLQLKRSYAEVEAQVAWRTRQLEAASQELLHSQKMNALGTLAAGIAHDFNNILSIIKGSAQIIEDNLDNPEKIRQRAGRINTVVEQGAGIVKAMLGFSRSSQTRLVMCDLNEIVAETIQLLGDRFLREMEVRFDPAPELRPVAAAKDFIQQILLNLLFNASEAVSTRRQVIITVGHINHLPPHLALAPLPDHEYVFISIQDFGAGIAPEILPRIFEPFFTTKAFSVRRGTGLGLSMVYELARKMDAGLAVESVVGQGSTFTLLLPIRELPMDDTQTAQPESTTPPSP